jgi:hypothetical protein
MAEEGCEHDQRDRPQHETDNDRQDLVVWPRCRLGVVNRW